jgi:hypothetical protein
LHIGNRWVLPDAHIIMKGFLSLWFCKTIQGRSSQWGSQSTSQLHDVT